MSPDRAAVPSTPVPGFPTRVRLDCDGPVATLTLLRPEPSTTPTSVDGSTASAESTNGGLTECEHTLSGDVRVVVVRGEGRSLSAEYQYDVGPDRGTAGKSGTEPHTGAQSPVSAEATGRPARIGSGYPTVAATAATPSAEAQLEAMQQAFAWLRRPDLVSIAVVDSRATGAGLQLALACDLRILSEDAQLAVTEVAQGLVPALGGTSRLVSLVGYSRALELCLTSRRVMAAEALRLGLATTVVPHDRLDPAVADLVAAILAKPRAAVNETKALLAAAQWQGIIDHEAAERQSQLRRLEDLAGLGE